MKKDRFFRNKNRIKEHGLSPITIYGWLGKDIQGLPTLGEMARLKRQN